MKLPKESLHWDDQCIKSYPNTILCIYHTLIKLLNLSNTNLQQKFQNTPSNFSPLLSLQILFFVPSIQYQNDDLKNIFTKEKHRGYFIPHFSVSKNKIFQGKDFKVLL